MFTKEDKEKFREIFSKHFNNKDKIKFYFFKKIANQDMQNTIVVKSRQKIDTQKFDEIRSKVRDDLKNSKLTFARYSEFVGKIIPSSKVYKIPFFDTEDIEVTNPWRVCPVGQHWVKRHAKQLSSGLVTDHDGHCRKNRSKKDILNGDEIELISHSELFNNPKIKVSTNNLKFMANGNKFNHLISGWTAYWNDIFKLENPLHPNYVKALIASESSFIIESKAQNKAQHIGLARGLIQITEETFRVLTNPKGELKDHIIDIELDDLWDPNINICVAIRWLFRKRETTKALLKREPTWLEVLMDYKGRLKSKTAESIRIKKELKKHLDDMEK